MTIIDTPCKLLLTSQLKTVLILYKDLQESTLSKQSLRKVLSEFDFRPSMHLDQKLKLKEDETNLKFYCDLIASFIQTHYAYNRSKITEKFILKAIRASRDIVLHNGYTELNIPKFRQNLDLRRDNIITVYGCQTRAILNSRVKAAVKLMKLIDTQIHLVFSGYNPKSNKSNDIANEAEYMENRFYDFSKLNKAISKYPKFDKISTTHIWIDQESTRTKENIKKVLELDLFNQSDKKWNLFLVSSTFHAWKLVEELESYIEENKIDKIDKIYVVGSEPVTELKPVCFRQQYAKALFYLLYFYILKKPVHYGETEQNK